MCEIMKWMESKGMGAVGAMSCSSRNLICFLQIVKSSSLKSYWMFQPSVPYLLRSLTIEWNMHRLNTNRLYTSILLQSLISMSFMFSYEFRRFARSPRRDCTVSFTPFCTRLSGNALVLSVVSQSLRGGRRATKLANQVQGVSV